MKVYLTEIISLENYKRFVNSLDLEKITLIDGQDKELYIDPIKVNEWKYMGLNNIDFFNMYYTEDSNEDVDGNYFYSPQEEKRINLEDRYFELCERNDFEESVGDF